MADCIPDRLPRQASQGELRLFSILSKLPDDCLVYYEPVVENRFPDFIVLLPSLGLMVIEVKGWRSGEILGGDLENVVVNYRGREQRQRHPIRQAREYMLSLMDTCQRNKQFQHLAHAAGDYQGRFVFPFGYFSILSNTTRAQLNEAGKAVLFPPEKVMDRQGLLQWEDFDQDSSLNLLKSYFDPWWPIAPLTALQIDTLRAIIHPEIMLLPFKDEPVSKESTPILVLDRRQETHARSLGNGHRILYGVPGSGKTVILIARAKLLAQANPEKEYLFLCYNRALGLYLQSLLIDAGNVVVRHFDAWSRDQGVPRSLDEDNDALGQRLLKLLQGGQGHGRKYAAVFIDEAQDFASSWFQCVLEAMEDPLDGDLLVVGDGNQGVYRNRPFSWAEVGIQAVGRTVHAKLGLDRCYRSTREIIALARIFAAGNENRPEDTIAAMQVSQDSCVRSSGFRPVLLKCGSLEEECRYAAALAKEMIAGKWFGRGIPQSLQPAQIGILYRKAGGDEAKRLLGELESEIGQAVWISRDRSSLTRISEPMVKIQTVHSAKGLQFKAVILLWAGQMPSLRQSDNLNSERKLMFVALTRTEEYLSVLHSVKSAFVSELESTAAADLTAVE